MNLKVPSSATKYGPALLVTALASAFFFQALFASMLRSSAWDEPHHIASGLLFFKAGRIVRPIDVHTPLLREIGGFFLRAGGVHLPENQDVEAILAGRPDLMTESRIGFEVLVQNGPEKVLFWARLPFILLGTGFVVVLYRLGKSLLGETVGLAAAFLFAFDPIMLSNAGLSFFIVLFVWALWAYVRDPRWVRLIWAGVALGAALASKFPATVILPVAGLLMAAAAESGSGRSAVLKCSNITASVAHPRMPSSAGRCVRESDSGGFDIVAYLAPTPRHSAVSAELMIASSIGLERSERSRSRFPVPRLAGSAQDCRPFPSKRRG